MAPPSPLDDDQLRQYINARTALQVLRTAQKEAAQVRGGMIWKEVSGKRYLVRTSTTGAQHSQGVESDETRKIFEGFHARKQAAQARLKDAKSVVSREQRLNKALYVGHVPSIVVRTLNMLRDRGFEDHFTVAGTHALYAYEYAAGVRVADGYLATNDIDLFYNSQKHLRFVTSLQMNKTTLIGLLRSVDDSFRVREDQKYTAINKHGFEVDIIRRPNKLGDVHPMPIIPGATEPDEDTFWAVQVPSGDAIASNVGFSSVVVAADGEVAQMNTIDPMAFVRIKLALSKSIERDPVKRIRDKHQAEVTQWMMDQGLLAWQRPRDDAPQDTVARRDRGRSQGA